jgi:Undecaprenyl-phosphate glucose phosphotransferase
MLRRHHRFFQSIQMLRDALWVGLTFWGASWLRFALPELLPYTQVPDPRETAALGLTLIAVWPPTGLALGLYRSRRARTAASEVADVCRTTVVAFLILVTLAYFVRDVRYSRATMLIWAALCPLGLGAARVATKMCLKSLRARGYNLRHVVVVGTGALAEHVLDAIAHNTSLGLRVVGALRLPEEPPVAGACVGGARVLGSVEALPAILAEHSVDQVLIALPIEALGALKTIMEVLSKETVDVRLIPDLVQYITLCGSVEEFFGMPIINLQSSPLWGWNLVLKRAFDIAAAALGCLMLSPVLLGVALAIRLSGPGPILYRQTRVGLDGSRFGMLKFRTMRPDAEAAGARFAQAGDPRCTAVGRVLRRLSVDELPQLFNVLCGHMSLVGPRPERPCFIETFKHSIPRYALRHKIKAGMTGWAQVNGMRGNTSIVKRIELDLYYIENWSFVLDLKILVRTVLGGFLSPHAY